MTHRDEELGSQAEPKQPDVGLCSADSEVSVGLSAVEFGLIGSETLFLILPASRGGMFCQSLVMLDCDDSNELGSSSLSDTDIGFNPGLITLARRSCPGSRCFLTLSGHELEFGKTLEFSAVTLLHSELGHRHAV